MLRICLLFGLLCLGTAAAAGPDGVLRVIDGDTFDVGGTRVRLHAIDAPETDQLCGGQGAPAWECGAWVRREVRARFDGQFATCETRDIDRYDRIVAICHIAGRDIGEMLVSDGLAFAYRQYGWDYDLQEKAAAVAGRGLHATGVTSPAAFRRIGRKAAVQEAPTGCTIKGNISRDGKRIYHMPGQNWYDKTRIDPTKGERWFCSEADARQAGWRKARR
ncbi:thermonuclease family protein [Thalassococcus sp. BH17M4-6]|uniref:thermonuclease family protein n=1 Tax=Thalassococcus sp. BH17M4-6 TaxID=3413148 RepID=UPI003BC82A3A